MILTKGERYLLDVNVLVALLDEDHTHHQLATEWFNTPGLHWALCSFTEAGLLRYLTRPSMGDMSVSDATAMLTRVKQHSGYHFQPITADWHTLCSPLFPRLYGTKQITEAFLLGLAMHERMILVTLDKGILHLAGEYQNSVLLLTEPPGRLQ